MLPFPIISSRNILPKKVIKKIDGASNIFILYDNGKLYSRGVNYFGQLGIGNTTNQGQWVLSHEDVKDIFSSIYGTYIIKNDDSIMYAGQGYTVNNGTVNVTTFTDYTSIFGSHVGSIKEIRCGAYSTLFLKNDGTLYGFGMNNNGELGSTSLNSYRGVQLIASNVKKMNIIDRSSGYLNNSGQYFRTGYNSFYTLGTGTNTQLTAFTRYGISYEVKDFILGLYCTYLLLRDETNSRMRIYNAGSSINGILGNGSTTGQKAVFSELTQFTDIDMIPTETFNSNSAPSSTLIFMNRTGTNLYSTGLNANSPFGNGSTGGNKLYLTADSIGIPAQGLINASIITSTTVGTFILLNDEVYASSTYTLLGVDSNIFINITSTLP